MIARRTLLASSPLLFAPALVSAAERAPLRSNPASLPPANGFSHLAEGRGRLIWLSGQVPRTPDGTHVAPGDFVSQLEQVFRNLDIAAREAGGRFADIVKLNYYCRQDVDRALLRHVNRVRGEYIDPARPPASTFLFVSALAWPEWLIEIEAVLALDTAMLPEVIVHATLTADKDFSPAFIDEIRRLAAATRSEPGCIHYRVGRDLDHPSAIVLAERWRDEAALRAHFETPHMARFQTALRAQGMVRTALEVSEAAPPMDFSLNKSAPPG
ncbi:antibiotic biosynthesis monooxygenase [Sphingopyxis kveilinensis]|uniref:antibiotic biosynthesis monooxygenase n=1 Tax=Sphingopyxis kveilinensis TaxID=3114367 RepID=UPI0030D14BC4